MNQCIVFFLGTFLTTDSFAPKQNEAGNSNFIAQRFGDSSNYIIAFQRKIYFLSHGDLLL